ncbi:Zn-ribbon domain-containing OB-fold protein [Gordonia sp. NPDC127522]|uniref:Zn-ribbon domain-containing OB-fold protein n=1 Tax=Gordonia sp. NPDC127522 TaxID=3345390 RepID=UPI00362C28BB
MSISVPASTELSAEYWSAAADHRLVVPNCEQCGSRFFPPERLCPACRSARWTYTESSGIAVIRSHTVVFRAPTADFVTPYIVAVVEVDNEWTMLTNIIGSPPDAVVDGMSVVVTFVDCDGGALPCFAPAAMDREVAR